MPTTWPRDNSWRGCQAELQQLKLRIQRLEKESRYLRSQQPTFYNFQNLPVELRLSIWKYLLPGRRTLRIYQ